MSTSRVHRCLEPGLSVIVGTADAHGVPSCCRGYAIRSDDDLQTLTVYVPVATSHEVIRSLAISKKLTVASVQTVDHSATQVKGTAIETRLAREDEASFVSGRQEAFADALVVFGVPRRLARTLVHWPAFAVTLRVEEIYEQTPGPKAGTRLR
jgi:hypothetical protein